MLLSTQVLEIPEINREGLGVKYGPDQDQVLLRPISTLKSGLLRERETSLVAGGSTTCETGKEDYEMARMRRTGY